MPEISKTRIRKIMTACRQGIIHIGGTDVQCAACGGNGKNLEYLSDCGCRRLRETITFLEKILNRKGK